MIRKIHNNQINSWSINNGLIKILIVKINLVSLSDTEDVRGELTGAAGKST